MSKTVTLGGDRLGSGKKQKVSMHGYERSSHNLGGLFRSTMAPGTLVPFLTKVGLPGDTFDIDLDAHVNTHPAIGPLFGSYKLQLDVFMAPYRLYNKQLHNNYLNIGRKMSEVKLPQLELIAYELPADLEGIDLNNSQINPSCILAYLGIRGVGTVLNGDNNASRNFNAVPYLAYWEIYKNYYANKQEEIGMVIHTIAAAIVGDLTAIIIDTNPAGGPTTNLPNFPAIGSVLLVPESTIELDYTTTAPDPTQIEVLTDRLGWQRVTPLFSNFIVSGTSLIGNYNYSIYGNLQLTSWRNVAPNQPQQGPPIVADFQLSNIDTMRDKILEATSAVAFQVNSYLQPPYTWIWEGNNDVPNALFTQEGLGVKTYQSDLFNNWLSTEWIDGPGGITEITSIDTTGGSFSLDTLLLSRKIYDMLNRIAISGGTYNDWISAVYDHEPYMKCESPMYCGGLSKEIVFQEVVNNSASSGTEGSQPLGTLAGKGVLSKKHKGGSVTIKCDEHCQIIGIVSITPRIDYSQGNNWDIHLKTMDDFYKPALAQIGFQELITEQLAWWDTTWNDTDHVWETQSAGKQPAWINYMTEINKTFGNFAIPDNEMFMTLNRRYQYDNAGPGIIDLTTYIDPAKFNFIFAQTSLDAQNFWVQIATDITARRKMSAKIIPNL